MQQGFAEEILHAGVTDDVDGLHRIGDVLGGRWYGAAAAG
jgi:hypothetical protein